VIRPWLVLLVLLAGVSRGWAQVATVATPVTGTFPTTIPVSDLEALTADYNSGQWTALQERSKAILGTIANGKPEVKAALDLRRHYIAITWVGRDPSDKTMLMRFVAHDPAPDLYLVDLPGIDDAYEVVLTRTASGGATSVYISTREQDPVVTALPQFIQALATPLFATIGEVGGAAFARDEIATLYATVKHVGLPFRRAAVNLKSSARDPWFDSARFTKGLTDLAARVRFDEVPYSRCGREYVDTLQTTLSSSAGCKREAAAVSCQNALEKTLADAYQAALVSCAGGKPSSDDVTAIKAVDKQFRDYVRSSLTNNAELEQTFKNVPPTRFAFGAGTAVMVTAHLSEPRVKLDDSGVLVADPLTRVVTMAFVNWSPWGYRADAPSMTRHERVRVQFGAVLTPDFGAMTGLNVLLARGIGITGGVAVLFAKGARQEEIGSKPADSKDPFRLSLVTAPFVGITYNYK
jgi:hypothetical protein